MIRGGFFNQVQRHRFVLLVLCLMLSFGVRANDPAGFVLMAAGKVKALQSNQETRRLKRKSPFYPGETLLVGANSKAQVRFRDGSLISLRAETEIRIDEFRFNEPRKGADKNIFTLLNGGFRTITGKIGKKNPSNYQMKSSVASIGVRGTTYEAVLNGGLSVAAWQGSIVLENGTGKMTLGAEGLYNYAVVASPESSPKGMMRPPAAIRDDKEIKPEEMEGEGGDDEAAVEEETEAADEEQSEEGDGSLAQEMEESPDGDPSTTTATDDAREPAEPPPYVPPEPEPEPEPIPEPTPDPVPDPIPDPLAGVDLRVASVNLDRIGMAVASGTGYSQMLAGGAAGYDAGGLFYIADNGLDPSQANFATDPYQKVLTQGGATTLAGMPQTTVIDTNHSLTWGVWQGSVAAPAELQTDSTDVSIFTAVEQPVYWGEATATPAAGFGRTGVASYRNVLGFIGGGNSGSISDIYMNLSVNFDSLAASANVNIYTPAEVWNLSMTGTLAAPVLQFSSVTGTVGANSIQGEFNSLFTGDNAQAIFSAFDLEAIADPSIHVEGLVLVDETAINDLRLSVDDLAVLDRVAVAVKINSQTGMQWLSGQSSDGLGGSPLIVEKGLSLVDPGLNSAAAFEVLRQGGASVVSSYDNGVNPVSWGVWSAGSEIQMSDYDPLDIATLSEQVRWMTVLPTSTTDMSSLVGEARYGPIFSEGNDQLGNPFLKFSIGLKVDFNLAQFTGAGMFETQANEKWDFLFGGNIDVAELSVTAVNSWRVDSAGNELTTSGDLTMLFTGNGAEDVAGIYEFELDGDASQYIMGNFMLGRDLRLNSTEVASMDRYGVAMKTNASPGAEWITGLASDGYLGSPLIAENFTDAGVPHFYLAPLSGVLKQGGATISTVMTDADFPVSWGIWNTGSDLYTDPGNAATFTNMADPFVWMTVLPTDGAVVSGRAGKAFYFSRQVLAGGPYFGMTDNGYGVDESYFDLALDFDTASFDGRLYTYKTSFDSWSIYFSGELFGAELDVTSIKPESNYYDYLLANSYTTLNADLSLVLTGANAEGVAVAYELEFDDGDITNTLNGDNYIQGAFVAGLEQRLSVAEMSDMNHLALLSGWSGYGFALSTSASGGQSPVFAHDGMGSYYPGDIWFELATQQGVYRQGLAPEVRLPAYQVSANPKYEVNWGRWNATAGTPGTYSWDPVNAPANDSDITNTVFWMTFNATPQDVLAAKTGQLLYNAPIDIIAGSLNVGADGDVNPASFSFSAMVDFDTGALNAGSMSVAHLNGAQWDMTFSAAAASMKPSGVFQWVSSNGTYTDTVPTIYAANGSMQLMLTGANAEALAGRFNFYDGAGLSKDMQGVFLVCQTSGC